MNRLIASLALLLFISSPAVAQLSAPKLYCTIGRAIPVEVSLGRESRAVPEIALVDGRTREEIARVSAAAGRVDLSTLFPVLWTTREPKLMYAQLFVLGESVGAPLVLQPMLAPRVARDGLTDAARAALDTPGAMDDARLRELPSAQREALEQSVALDEPGEPHYAGLRVYVDQFVRLETSAGEMVFRLRPDMAPNTVHHFRSLVVGGFYDNTAVHRIIPASAGREAFIVQAGDPIGTGYGGPGFSIDFEPSALPHRFGVLSMARIPTDPNSAGSQFFICLSRSMCAGLDGQYTSFAELVDGGETLVTLAEVPVTARDPEDPNSAVDRPLDPPVIVHAELIDAPGALEDVTVITEPPAPSAER